MSFKEWLKGSGHIEYDIQPGDTLNAGIGAEIKYDERSPNVVRENFDIESEPGDEVFYHFTEDRGNFHNLEETSISSDERGNPLFSDLVEYQIGECLEMALVGLNYVQDEADEVYLVNGSLPDIDRLNVLTPDHSYLILENSGEYQVFDPATLIDGEPVRGKIVGLGEFSTLELEENLQKELESEFGQKYALQ